MKRAAVLGSPIDHSLSPVLHQTAYRHMGLDWTYQAIDCDEAGLPGFFAKLDETWAGLSLTMPLKHAVLPLLDRASELVHAAQTANTVILRDGISYGENTDVYGMVTALREGGITRPDAAIVLGGGATACSALAALRELGLTTVAVVVRDQGRGVRVREVAERLGVEAELRPWTDLPALVGDALLVSTLPAGAADEVAACANRARAVFDVVYRPWPTALAVAARTAGRTAIGGFPLLLHQAVRQVELMTDRTDVPVEAMRAAGERARAAPPKVPR